jgi:hypothetical protein
LLEADLDSQTGIGFFAVAAQKVPPCFCNATVNQLLRFKRPLMKLPARRSHAVSPIPGFSVSTAGYLWRFRKSVGSSVEHHQVYAALPGGSPA